MSTSEYTEAAGLTAGTVVANNEVAAFRILDGPGAVWRTTDGKRLDDGQIDGLLAAGAHILRAGYEQGGRTTRG